MRPEEDWYLKEVHPGLIDFGRWVQLCSLRSDAGATPVTATAAITAQTETCRVPGSPIGYIIGR